MGDFPDRCSGISCAPALPRPLPSRPPGCPLPDRRLGPLPRLVTSASHHVSHILSPLAPTSLAQLEAWRSRRLVIAYLMKLVNASLIGGGVAAALDSRLARSPSSSTASARHTRRPSLAREAAMAAPSSRRRRGRWQSSFAQSRVRVPSRTPSRVRSPHTHASVLPVMLNGDHGWVCIRVKTFALSLYCTFLLVLSCGGVPPHLSCLCMHRALVTVLRSLSTFD